MRGPRIDGLPPRFHLLIAAQFASALADNALLIVAIEALREQARPDWWAPLLKFAFTLSYVFLAPFVGPLADAFPKARLMAWMNGVKVIGVIGLVAGWHPVAAFVVVGFGAAAYAPAKYGLLTELVAPQRLVAANGWVEVSVVFAALLGTVLGGWLVAPHLLDGSLAEAIRSAASDWLPESGQARLSPSMLLLLIFYALAGALNLSLPDSGARYPASGIHPVELARDFRQANRLLWSDRDGGLSLLITTIFWGVGATLQFAVLRWAADRMAMPLDQSAMLQAAVAVGVIAGATIAGRCVPIAGARRMLIFGVLQGVLVAAVAWSTRLSVALPLMVAVGVVGGLLVVPMNALLQHRGYSLLSAGRSIAVQGFNENASILAMLAVYAGLLAAGMPIVTLMVGFGGLIAVAMGLTMLREARRANPGEAATVAETI